MAAYVVSKKHFYNRQIYYYNYYHCVVRMHYFFFFGLVAFILPPKLCAPQYKHLIVVIQTLRLFCNINRGNVLNTIFTTPENKSNFPLWVGLLIWVTYSIITGNTYLVDFLLYGGKDLIVLYCEGSHRFTHPRTKIKLLLLISDIKHIKVHFLGYARQGLHDNINNGTWQITATVHQQTLCQKTRVC